MRVVVLTDRSPRGVAILEALTRAGIRNEAIIIDLMPQDLKEEVKAKLSQVKGTHGS
jgi:hypothetical protein